MAADANLRCDICNARMEPDDVECPKCGTKVGGRRALDLHKARRTESRRTDLMVGVPVALAAGLLWGLLAIMIGRNLAFVSLLIGALLGYVVYYLRKEHSLQTAVVAVSLTLAALVVGKTMRAMQFSSLNQAPVTTKIMLDQTEIVAAIAQEMQEKQRFSEATTALLEKEPDVFHIETIQEAQAVYESMSDAQHLAIAKDLASTIVPTDSGDVQGSNISYAFGLYDVVWLPMALLVAFVFAVGLPRKPGAAAAPAAPPSTT